MEKFKNLSRFVLVFVLIHVVLNLTAQTNISSPYSRYGLGQINGNYSVKAMSMGGVCLANSSNDFINISNPASYIAFDTTSFVFDGGINGVFTQLKNQSTSVNTMNLSLNYLLFGFPISKRFAFSFGLLPYSNMGYTLKDSSTVPNIGNIDYSYKGDGGFNKFFGGASFKIVNGLSVGANMSYLFGSLNKTRTVTFPEGVNIYSVQESDAYRISDIIFDYGLLYKKKFNNGNALSAGLITGLSSKINARESILTQTFSGTVFGSTYIKDTLQNTSTKGNIIIPSYYGGGLMFKKAERWLIGADYKFQEWSKFSSFGITDSLKNSMQAAIGLSLFPSNSMSNSIFKKTTYRLGFRMAQTYLQLRNTQLKEYAVSFGFTFPMSRSKSALNLGFELGQRGTVNNNLIKETFGMVSCSLSIYERWFIRRKYE